MSTKSKSIETKTDFNQDERLKKVSKLRLLLNRPELGALGGAILVLYFLVSLLEIRGCSVLMEF